MSKILTRALNLSGASAIAQVMLILSTPIITRLYSPEDFSFYAIIISFSLLVIPLSNMKYELALPLIQSKNNVHLSRLSLKFNLLAFLTLSFVFFLLSFVKFENDLWGQALSYWYAIPILAVLAGRQQFLNLEKTKLDEISLISFAKVIQSAILITVQFLGGIFGVGFVGLVVGQIFNYLSGILFLQKRSHIEEQNNIKELALLRRYRRFPKFTLLEDFMHSASAQIPILLLSVYLGGYELGLLYMAIRLLTLPVTLVTQSLSNLFFVNIYQFKKSGVLESETKSILDKILYFVFLPITVILFFLKDYIGLILGNEWSELGYYFLILVPWVLQRALSSTISTIMYVNKKNNLLTFMASSGFMFRVISIIIFAEILF